MSEAITIQNLHPTLSKVLLESLKNVKDLILGNSVQVKLA